MDTVINGQVVPAVGQWQGLAVIGVSLAIAYVRHRWQSRRAVTRAAK